MDYGGTAKELKAYFNHCGEIHRVTILCDKFSGHPKGSVRDYGQGGVRRVSWAVCTWPLMPTPLPPAMPT